MTTSDNQAVGRELDRIRSLEPAELRLEWKRLYNSPPPKISRGSPAEARRRRASLKSDLQTVKITNETIIEEGMR